MTNVQHDLEYLCRICAANTKGKNSVPECVYILKTPTLKEKIERHLFLSIVENDTLPKVLCKTCFRQVEATASLSKIAKHTQKVFREFLNSIKPKPPKDASWTNNDEAEYTDMPMQIIPKENERSDTHSVAETEVISEAEKIQTTSESSPSSRKDEVIVNVSISDPLTRETQQKMISASQKSQMSATSTPRYTPKSIAQRALPSTPKQAEISPGGTSKKPSPAGVINFFKGQPQQVTTYSSGGYVIGRVSGGANAPSSVSRASLSSNNSLQQKRKNLKMALSNLKTIPQKNTGRVSLLKVSQKKSTSSLPSLPQSKRTSSKVALNPEETQVAELPEQIIIAATKNQKHQSSTDKFVATPVSEAVQELQQLQQQQQQQLQQQPPPPLQHISYTKSGIPDDIILGQVIKDSDLLKLILKALKWPVDTQNIDLQMMRLRNSKFADIMADQNLLQDADLTQIMGPYLAPVLLAAHTYHQQQLAAVSAASAVAEAAAHTAARSTSVDLQTAQLATAISYKLPAETSVQLVPANPSEEKTTLEKSALGQTTKLDIRTYPRPAQPKKIRKLGWSSARDSSIIVSDAEDFNIAFRKSHHHHRSSSSKANVPSPPSLFHIDFEPSLLSQLSNSGDTSNDALVALLRRQHAALNRLQSQQSRQVPVGGGDLNFDVDDIVLMEDCQSCPESQTAIAAPRKTSDDAKSANADQCNFKVPAQVTTTPPITRPIIKRRKTVIQTSTSRNNPTVNALKHPSNSDDGINLTKSAANTDLTLRTSPKKHLTEFSESTPLSDGTQMTSNNASVATQCPSKTNTSIMASTNTPTTATVATSVTSLALEPHNPPPAKSSSKKAQSSKSILGQQLLEAVGLQKVQNNTKIKEDLTSHSTFRDSVQQIRSALKKSLKEKQEQQQKQRKQETTVIQDADSTTKSVVKEILVEAKAKNVSGSTSSADVDVEDEISKIALVVQKKSGLEYSSKIPRQSTGANVVHKSFTLLQNTKKENLEVEAATTDTMEDNYVRKKTGNSNIQKQETTPSDSVAETSSGSVAVIPPRKRGRKRKEQTLQFLKTAIDRQLAANEDADHKDNNLSIYVKVRGSVRYTTAETERDSDSASTKNEANTTAATTTSSRPSRVSKTLSKYYKGPDKVTSRRDVPPRSTRSRY